MSVSGTGSADSVYLYVSVYHNGSYYDSSSGCHSPLYNNGNKSEDVFIQPSTVRGIDGDTWYARGYAIDYGNDSCSGGYPINDLEGRLDVDLWIHQDDWLPESTVYTSCNY